MTEPPILEGEQCPNCGKSILVGNNWCPHCGYNKQNIGYTDQSKGKYPFSWIWFASLFFLVPLAACGGCLLVGAQGNLMSIALVTMILGWVVGICLLFYNGIKGRQ